jgi:hypothetical protein
VLGALIGDGDTKYKGQVKLASKDSSIPNYIGKILNGEVVQTQQYSWKITNSSGFYKQSKFNIPYYNEWLLGKTFLHKNFDWKIVNTWNRKSCLKLLAGLIDTDGSINFQKNCLEIQYHSSNLELINNVDKLVYKLWGYRGTIKQDNREEKYNYPHFKFRIRDTYISKLILKEVSRYIQKSYKKYLPFYDTLKTKRKENYNSFTKGNTSFKQTYDLQVNNSTHLYVLADRLVTHNSSDLCIVDEAGFCDDLTYIIQSILIPTTTTTHGKIILSSTPPRLADHEFIRYMEEAEDRGSFLKKTIYDALGGGRITQEMIDEIIRELGGAESPDFRREYLCVTGETLITIKTPSGEIKKITLLELNNELS